MKIRQLYRFKLYLEVVTCIFIISGVLINAVGIFHNW